jgi:tetratricopeptide (TPR) repeat protein
MNSDAAKKFFAGISLLLMTVLLGTDSLAQANNSITGFVFGLENKPLSNVTVELQDDLYRMLARTETNGAGRYNFTRLARGRYHVKVFSTGTNYQEQARDVEITGPGRSVNSGNEMVQQNFYLQLKAASTALSTFKNSVIFAQEVPQEAEKIYQKAISALDNKKTEAGITDLKKALEIFPNYYLALERLAKEFVSREDYGAASETAGKCVEVNDGSYECWYILGFSAYKMKNNADAVKAFEKAVLILPNSINALFMLGVNLRQTGRFEQAEESFLKAKKLAPAPISDLHWHLALLYTNNLKKYAAAVTELELFLKAKPDFEEAEKVRDLIKKLREKVKGPSN